MSNLDNGTNLDLRTIDSESFDSTINAIRIALFRRYFSEIPGFDQFKNDALQAVIDNGNGQLVEDFEHLLEEGLKKNPIDFSAYLLQYTDKQTGNRETETWWVAGNLMKPNGPKKQIVKAAEMRTPAMVQPELDIHETILRQLLEGKMNVDELLESLRSNILNEDFVATHKDLQELANQLGIDINELELPPLNPKADEQTNAVAKIWYTYRAIVNLGLTQSGYPALPEASYRTVIYFSRSEGLLLSLKDIIRAVPKTGLVPLMLSKLSILANRKDIANLFSKEISQAVGVSGAELPVKPIGLDQYIKDNFAH